MRMSDSLSNIFGVVRQFRFSEKTEQSLDLGLFLNGIPIFTAELKNPLNGQDVNPTSGNEERYIELFDQSFNPAREYREVNLNDAARSCQRVPHAAGVAGIERHGLFLVDVFPSFHGGHKVFSV